MQHQNVPNKLNKLNAVWGSSPSVRPGHLQFHPSVLGILGPEERNEKRGYAKERLWKVILYTKKLHFSANINKKIIDPRKS